MILMKTVLAAILTCLLTFAFLPAGAVQPDEIMADQKLETRARALSAQLRCMVCQNESIDDSGAPVRWSGRWLHEWRSLASRSRRVE